jgi:hypothetical protein
MPKRRTLLVATLVAVLLPFAAAAAKEQPPETSHDGLVLQPKTKLALVYLKPGVDFTAYDKVALLECEVAFKKNWQREQNQTDPFRVSKKDMDDIRAGLAELFREVFTEELGKGGYALAESAAPDVLILRPGIIDLDVTAPAAADMGAGRSRTFSTSAGAMTLVLEVYDSSTGEILARVADRKAARDQGYMTWQNAATNRSEAKRVIKGWAETLRNGLDTLKTRAATGGQP